VVVDPRTGPEADWSQLARRMCERHLGIGADGLLVIANARGADAGMAMYNPDGSEDFCGNGLRCVARYIADGMPAAPEVRLAIATAEGARAAVVRYGDGDALVTVDMVEPEFEPGRIPMDVAGPDALDFMLPIADGRLAISALSTGSTHAVTFVDALPDDTTFERVSRQVEVHPLFPKRTSLMWVRADGPDRLAMRIWERGVGETLGCGTGACAAAVAAQRKGLTGRTVTVASAGGALTVTWSPGEPILMTGPAEYVFEGVYRL